MNQRLRQILIHVTGWIIFLTLPALFLPGRHHVENLLSDPRVFMDGARNLLLIGFFYLNYLVLVPRYYFNGKRVLFVALILACYLAIATIPSAFFMMGPPPDLDGMPPRPQPNGEWEIWFRLSRHFLLFALVLVFSMLLRIADRWRQAEREKKIAEVAYLQAQINPHFLFNTLNTIYSLALTQSDQAANAVVKLSNMMRHVITEANQSVVALEKELEYLDNYLALQQLRFGPRLSIHLEKRGYSTGKRITPLLFMTLVENAFKYGVNPEENSSIYIEIDIEEHEIHLMVKNQKVRVNNVENTGLGLNNVRKRLALLYPGKHVLTISDKTNEYSVSLLVITT